MGNATSTTDEPGNRSRSPQAARLQVTGAGPHAPQVRCFQCRGVFQSSSSSLHCRCPYCSAVNGVALPAGGVQQLSGLGALAAALNNAPSSSSSSSSSAAPTSVIRRLQAREVTPLVRSPPAPSPPEAPARVLSLPPSPPVSPATLHLCASPPSRAAGAAPPARVCRAAPAAVARRGERGRD